MPTPPPFEPIANCIHCRISAAYQPAAATAINLLSFKTAEAVPTPAECVTVANLVASWCNDHYAGIFCSDWNILKIEAFGMDSPTGAYHSEFIAVNGTLAAVSSRPDWAPLLLLGTGERGRSFHGRVYTFPPDAAGVLPQNTAYTPVHQASMISAFNALITASAAASVPLAVGSPTLGTATVVTGLTVSNRMTLQTRRRPGFGI